MITHNKMKNIKTIMKYILLAGILIIGLGVIMMSVVRYKKSHSYRYVVTNFGKPTSFDPLEADYYNNLPIARMIYLTPMEVSETNDFSSDILEKFQYDTTTNTIIWKVKKGLSFSDGSSILTEDVAFSVIRMLYTRPDFPVLKYVKGLNEWLKQDFPLKSYPSGISVEKDIIKIEFDQVVSNPLYRFCLELFSIIPKKCVDLKTNKITCQDIPTSGKYKISNKSDKEWLFSKNSQIEFNGPEEIIFEFWGKKNLVEKIQGMDNYTVVHSDDIVISLKDQRELKKNFKIVNRPVANFSALLMNPKNIFKNKNCRKVFAMTVTKTFSQVSGSTPEASIFTKIIPGYLTVDELDKQSESSFQEDLKGCKGELRSSPPQWGIVKRGESSPTTQLTKDVYVALKLPSPTPVFYNDYP